MKTESGSAVALEPLQDIVPLDSSAEIGNRNFEAVNEDIASSFVNYPVDSDSEWEDEESEDFQRNISTDVIVEYLQMSL